MRFIYLKIIGLFILISLLTGCLFPQDELAKNKVPHEDQLQIVQDAVDKYRVDSNGLLPIKTKADSTAIYEKYLIDFNILKDQNYISDIPGNAFENGGPYQYTIIDPEDDPKVKLIDLRLTDELRSINIKLDRYRSKNLYPPYGEKIDDDIYKLNYEKLGLKEEPTVKSPYTQVNLPIVINKDGELFIDYRIDLNNALNEYEHDYEPGDDIRHILALNTPFVPAYSLPYTIKDDEPVFLQTEWV